MTSIILGSLALLLAHTVLAGQEELMQAWSAKKQAVTNKVYKQLREEGKLPRDGTVEFEAHTQPDPKQPGSVLIKVDEVRISPSPADSKQGDTPPPTRDSDSTNKRFTITTIKPVTLHLNNLDSSQFITYENLDIPVHNNLVGRFEVRRGVIMPPSKEQKPRWRAHGGKQEEQVPAEP